MIIIRKFLKTKDNIAEVLSEDIVQTFGPIITNKQNYSAICHNPVNFELENGFKFGFTHSHDSNIEIHLQAGKNKIMLTYDCELTPAKNFDNICEGLSFSDLDSYSMTILHNNIFFQKDQIINITNNQQER